MKIDAHQHFWTPKRGDYGWLTPELTPLYRDYLPQELAPILRENGVDKTILVQAAPTVAETEYLLSLAEDSPFVLGVVGWVDFEAPDAADHIAQLAENPKLIGLRPMIENIADVDWMLSRAFRPVFDAMVTAGLTFDALVEPKHLSNLQVLLARHPDLRVVIDHAAKPDAATCASAHWAQNMSLIAKNSAAYVKLSGLVTEAGPDWSVAAMQSSVDHLLEHFGPDRVIWGSDWPVCTLATSYDEWCEATDQLLSHLDAPARDAILGGNAARAYNFEGTV